MDCRVFLRFAVIPCMFFVVANVQLSNDPQYFSVVQNEKPIYTYTYYHNDAATPTTLFWDKSRETALEFNNRLCHERCNGTSKVNPVDSDQCLRCFPCTCSSYCDKEGTCCPRVGQDWVPSVTDRAECRSDFAEKNVDVLQVVKCHPAFPSWKQRDLCESKTLPRRRDTVLPVTSNDSFVTYVNVHCAACNYDDGEAVEWGVRCLHNQYLYDAMNDTRYDERAIQMPDLCGCVRNTSIHDYHGCPDLSFFAGHAVSSCYVADQWSEEGEDVLKACEESETSRGTAVLVKNGQLYANAFCAQCNEDEESVLERCNYLQTTTLRPPGTIYPTLTTNVIRTFTRLIFDGLNVNPIMTPVRSDCLKGSWPHPKGECRELQCAAGKTLQGGRCKTAVSRVTGLGYRLHIQLRPLALSYNLTHPLTLRPTRSAHEETCHYGIAVWQDMEAKLGDRLVDRSVNITTAAAANEACFAETYQKHLEMLINHENTSSKAVGDRTIFELNLEDIATNETRFLATVVEANILEDPAQPRDAVEMSLADSVFDKEWEVQLGEWTLRLKAFDVSTELLRGGKEQTDLAVIDVSDVDKTMLPYKTNTSPLIGLEHLFLPFTSELICPHLRFERDAFTLVTCDECDTQIKFPYFLDSDHNPLTFLAKSYPRGAWLTEDGHLAMCIDTFSGDVFPQNVTVLKPAQRQTSMVRQVMSAVCGSVSVVCLAVTFVTYALFRQLRALPGLNNMGLSLSLATAQLSLLLPWHMTGVTEVCRAVGVFTHWAWLTAFGWMGVCCVHMVRVFTSKTHHSLSEREVKKAFMHHVLATCLSAGVIVVITVVVSSAVSGAASMGYGGTLCFLDTEFHPLLLLAVLLPLGFVVLTNLTCFAITVVAIVRKRRLQSRAHHERRDVLVYAKLVTVTGGAWVLGFLAELTDQEWMRVVAELCIAAQGLLVFLAYVCNKRVWRLYRARFGTSPPPPDTTCTPPTPATALTSANTVKTSSSNV